MYGIRCDPSRCFRNCFHASVREWKPLEDRKGAAYKHRFPPGRLIVECTYKGSYLRRRRCTWLNGPGRNFLSIGLSYSWKARGNVVECPGVRYAYPIQHISQKNDWLGRGAHSADCFARIIQYDQDIKRRSDACWRLW